MAYYIDPARGSDSNAGTSSSAPWASLAKLEATASASIPAGTEILLASDSVFDIQELKTAQERIVLANLTNGTEASPIIISSYGGSTQKPLIRYSMQPTASGWWDWDADVQAWYIELDIALWGRGGFGILFNGVPGIAAGDGFQVVSKTEINNVGYNGVTVDTLRWVNASENSGKRLYVAGAGIDAVNNPSQVYSVLIYPSAALIGHNSFNNTHIDGIEFEGGGLYLTYGAGTLNMPGFVLRNCRGRRMAGIIKGVANNAASDSLIEIEAHNNVWDTVYASGYALDGAFVGSVHHDDFSDGNLCASFGGFTYIQATKNTGGHGIFEVHHNVARRAHNGKGNRRFDGCAFYIDVGDDGSVIRNNIIYDSYKAIQLNNGKAATVHGNAAINCTKLLSATDANKFDAVNYTITHNLLVASEVDAHAYGDQEQPTAAIVLYKPLDTPVTGVRIDNNIIDATARNGDVFAGVRLYQPAMWSGTGVENVVVRKNALLGGLSKLVTDTAAADKSSIYPDWITGAGGYPLDRYSGGVHAEAVIRAGHTYTAQDANGNPYCDPPTLGPVEPQCVSARWL